MKKIIALAMILILSASAVMPVMAKEDERRERTVFETTYFKEREGEYLSVYDGNIRELKNGEWSECNGLGLCYCTQLYHVLEDTTEDNFYSAFFKDRYDDYVVYSDCSTSMQQTFSYEKSFAILKRKRNEN